MKLYQYFIMVMVEIELACERNILEGREHKMTSWCNDNYFVRLTSLYIDMVYLALVSVKLCLIFIFDVFLNYG